MKYPLVASSWGTEEIEALHRIVDSGNFTMGEEVRAFEKEFAQKFGAKHAVMVNSGSNANFTAIASLIYKDKNPLRRPEIIDGKVIYEGDEVIVPAISWSTTYTPFEIFGIKLRVVDVDLCTLNIDIAKLEAALTPQTKAVVAVNILGNPCNLFGLRKFCNRHGLYLIEDNCESMGASISGKYCGTFGDVGTFSTFFSHHISTMEGGMILTDDEELCHRMRAFRAHGWDRDLPANSPIACRPENWRYEMYNFTNIGLNHRPTELNGAVGRIQLRKLDGFVEQRRKNAEVFTDLFDGDERFITQREFGKSSWFDFSVILRPELAISRDKIWDGLKAAGIEHRPITGGNFVRHPAERWYRYECAGELPNANLAHDNGFFIGNFGHDIRKEIEYFHKKLVRLVS